MATPLLPLAVEELIKEICREQAQAPPGEQARRELALIGEIEAINLLSYIRGRRISRSFDGYINYLSKSPSANPRSQESVSRPSNPNLNPIANAASSSSSPRHVSVGSSSGGASQPNKRARFLDFSALGVGVGIEGTDFPHLSPHMNALFQLEFKRAFMLLTYIGRNKLEQVASLDDIQTLQTFQTMASFESAIWTKYGIHFCFNKDRLKAQNFERVHDKRFSYHCHVSPDGNYYFKGPFVNKTATHLQRAAGDDNILIVKFQSKEAQSSQTGSNPSDYSATMQVFEQGIFVGPKRFQFFVFKDGGREKKRKSPSSNPVKCYFVDVESFAKFNSVHKTRSLFMHIQNASSMSNYMARFSLILSKTVKMDIDLDDVHFQDIEDIPCLTKDGEKFTDIDGKLMIQTDGTGFISEDLALRCPQNCYKGTVSREQVIGLREQFVGLTRSKSLSEPPLLIQFRMFYKGRAVKGTVLVNKKLSPNTIQVRPSMIKIEADPGLCGAPSIDSFEIVGTSNKPKKSRLSKNLIALLNYGGVPKEFFLDILATSIIDAKSARCNRKAALEVALSYGDVDDDLLLTRMISSGMPLDEPYLQHRISFLVKEEKKSLKSGKLPMSDSFYLMGTADPTGVLNSNEVCVILEHGQLSGKVLVYRNPGIHFGDIHVVDAVYVKAIEEVVGNAKYGILFSTKGPRSLADEIAGGDYDGDMYWVSRNPQLLEYFKPSEPWTCMHSSPSVPSLKPSDLPAQELEANLFQLFMAATFQPSNSMGVAASCWLAYMDRLLTLGENCIEEKSLLKEKILKLIDMYYDALDAPKKSKKVEIPRELVPEKYPHHMERGAFCTYRSTSVLGVIHDTVDEFRDQESPVPVRKLPIFDVGVPEQVLESWEQHYKSYRLEMSDALKLEGQLKNDTATEIYRKYNRILYGADELEKSPRVWEDIKVEALALYHVAYNYAIKQGTAQYCGFAWKVAGSALIKIVLHQQQGKPLCIPPSVLLELLK